MIWNLIKNFKRLAWFLGIPSTIIGLLFLVRLFFLSKNPEAAIPVGINPNNKVKFSSLKSFNLSDMEDELTRAKRFGSLPDSKKVIPLVFPDKDSMYNQQIKDIYPEGQKSEIYNRKTRPNLDLFEGKRKSQPEPEYYYPSPEEVAKYENNTNHLVNSDPSQTLENEKPSKFNSYVKPETLVKNNNEKERGNLLKARIIGNQVITEGSEVQARTMNEIFLNETRIPINTILIAFVTYENNRINLIVNSIHFGNLDFETHMEAIDKDGKPGLKIPEMGAHDSKLRDMASQLTDELASQSPILSSSISRTARKVVERNKKVEVKLNDGYDLNFINNLK